MPPTSTITVSGLSTRAATVPGSWNDDSRTVEVMWSSGSPAPQRDWDLGNFIETLEVTEKACDLSRLNAGASVLDQHNMYRGIRGILGVVERAWIKAGQGYALIRFSDREEIADLVRDIKNGIIHQFSMGYRVYRYEDISEKDSDVKRYHAVEWQPYELSPVTIAAEVGAGTRSADHAGTPYQVEVRTQSTMPPEFGNGVAAAPVAAPASGAPAPTEGNRVAAPAAPAPAPAPAANPHPAPASERSDSSVAAEAVRLERERVRGIEDHCRVLRLPATAVRSLVDSGRGLSDLSTEIARAYELANPDPVGEIRSQVAVGEEDLTKRRSAAIEALAARMRPGTPMPAEAGEFRGRSLVDTVRLMEQLAGNDGLRMSLAQVQQRAFHTTGDLPFLLEEAGRRSLRAAFDLLPETYSLWTNSGTMTDFRPHDRIRVGDAPKLEEVPDGADIKFGTVGESKETIKLLSYASGVALGRRSLINDDLGGFARLIQSQAQRVADLISSLVYGELATGKVGGKSLFDTSYKNTSTGALSVASLGLAEAKMLKQKSVDGMPLRLMPKFLLVPTDLKALADQLTTVVNPTQATEVNQFAGRLTTVVEPRLDDASATQWLLVADPARIDTIEVGWLEGNVGPQFDSAEVFANKGMKFSVWADVCAKALDHRGFVRSTGVA